MGSTETPRYLRVLASWRAQALIAVVVVLSGLLGVRTLHGRIAARALDSVVAGSQSTNMLVVNRNLTIHDVWAGVDDRNRASMDGDLFLLRDRNQLLGLRVWALNDGHLVYADSRHTDLKTALSRSDLERARTGRPFTRNVVDEPSGTPVVAIYLPFDINGDGSMDAVSEMLVPHSTVDGSMAQDARYIYAFAALVLVLVLVVLVALGRHQRSQERAATHDALTGLGNRLLLTRLARTVLPAATVREPAALLSIDLDGFKGVNDTLGHHGGDELLVTVAERLSNACAEAGGVAIRLGGDEFAVLMHGLHDRAAAVDLARAVQGALRRPVTVAGVTVEVDASIGVTYAPDHGTGLEQVLRCADVAMYHAKGCGAGVTVYQPGLDLHGATHLMLLPQLRRALADGQLELYYQPRCAPGRPVSGVEALVRWRHPARGLLNPDQFLPYVEKTSLIKELTAWVVKTAAGQHRQWLADGVQLPISVNVAARDLLDGDLVAQIRAATRAAGVPMSAIQVEFSETALLGDQHDRVSAVVRDLVMAGAAVAVDDLGGGYAPILATARLPVRTIKIHPTLTARAASDPTAAALVTSIVGTAQRIDAMVLAEGAETAEALRTMHDLGCDEVQGLALTPPLAAEDALEWINRWNARNGRLWRAA